MILFGANIAFERHVYTDGENYQSLQPYSYT